MLKKRYWLFGGNTHYAAGGVNDFIHSFSKLDEAIATGTKLQHHDEIEWWHVCDIVDMLKIVESDEEACGSYGLPPAPAKLG